MDFKILIKMMENKIILVDFLKKLQLVQPTLDDFLKAGYDLKTSKDLFKKFDIKFKESSYLELNNLFDDFFKNFNIKGFSPGNWSFEQEPYKVDNFIVFATDDIDLLAQDLYTNEIKLFDFFDYSKVTFIAPNFKTFLDVVIIEIEYDKVGYLNQDFTKEMRITYKEKLKTILKNNKFLDYFSYN